MSEKPKDLELFDVEEESTGWVREVVFFFRGKRGKMFLAYNGTTGEYTNCEILQSPVFDNEADEEAFEDFWDDAEDYRWDEWSYEAKKEN